MVSRRLLPSDLGSPCWLHPKSLLRVRGGRWGAGCWPEPWLQAAGRAYLRLSEAPQGHIRRPLRRVESLTHPPPPPPPQHTPARWAKIRFHSDLWVLRLTCCFGLANGSLFQVRKRSPFPKGAQRRSSRLSVRCDRNPETSVISGARVPSGLDRVRRGRGGPRWRQGNSHGPPPNPRSCRLPGHKGSCLRDEERGPERRVSHGDSWGHASGPELGLPSPQGFAQGRGVGVQGMPWQTPCTQ